MNLLWFVPGPPWDADFSASPRPDEVRPNDCDVCEVWDPWNVTRIFAGWIHSLKLTARPWKWMVGILVSYWDGLFSGAMLVSGRVYIFLRNIKIIFCKIIEFCTFNTKDLCPISELGLVGFVDRWPGFCWGWPSSRFLFKDYLLRSGGRRFWKVSSIIFFCFRRFPALFCWKVMTSSLKRLVKNIQSIFRRDFLF